MKVVLFHTCFKSPVSVLISCVTLSKYSHSAVCVDGAVYDAIQRGFYCAGRIKDFEDDRKITVIDIPLIDDGEAYKEVLKLQEKSICYDESTIFRWIKNEKDNKKLYCFEAVAHILKSFGYKVDITKRLTAKKILTIIKQNHFKIEFVGKPSDYKEEVS